AGTEHRAGLVDSRLLERKVEVLFVEPRSRCAAGDEGFEPFPVAHATAVDRRFDQITEGRDAVFDLVHTGLVDVPRHREHAHALARLRAERGERVAAMTGDPR